MAYSNPTYPNLPDFIVFCRGQGVLVSNLPDSSEYFQAALDYAKAVALYIPQMDSVIYVGATYNLGLHNLIKIAIDEVAQTFFVDQRAAYKMLQFITGSISSSTDGGTSQSFAVSDALQNMTLSGIDLLKTPWGREYLEYAQSYSDGIVGVS